MRIVIAITLFIVAFATDIKSQDILLLPDQTADSTQQPNKTFVVIKGDDIRRFPSVDFMDAVNGLFPWVFSQYHDPNEFLFVVNGFVLPDINSISLNDIEEIIFTRNNLYGTLFPFSRAGTFLIKTKTAQGNKLQINFNTQYNTVWNKNGYLPGAAFGISGSVNATSNESDNKAGHYWSNHLSLSFAGKKIKAYISAEANSEKFAAIRQNTIFSLGPAPYADTVKSVSTTTFNSQKVFMNLSYTASKKIDIGVMAGYSHFAFDHDLDYTSFAYTNKWQTSIHSKNPLNYYHAAVFLKYRILKNLVNTLWAEHAFEKMAWEYTNTTGPVAGSSVPMFSGKSDVDPKIKSYLVKDKLTYNLLSKGKFTSDVSLIVAYLKSNLNVDASSQAGMSWSYYKSSLKEKTANLDPLFNFSYNKFISGYFGATFLIGKKSFKNVEEKDKSSFYSGIEINFTHLLKSKKAISDLTLSANYGDLLKNNANNYWLNPLYLANGFFPRNRFEATLSNYNPFQSSNLTLSRNKLLSFTLSTSLRNNKFRVITEWSQLKTERIYYLYVSPGYTVPARGSETIEGLSIAFSGKIIDNNKIKFKSALNLLFPKTKLDQFGTLTGAAPYRSSLRSGLQNRVDYKNFFLQANALIDIGHVYYIYPNSSGFNPIKEKHNDVSINYVVLGYQATSVKTPPFKDMSIFLQTRNLFVSKKLRQTYEFDHYAGIGVNLCF